MDGWMVGRLWSGGGCRRMIVGCAIGYRACARVCGILVFDLTRCGLVAVGAAETNILKRLGCLG